MKITKETLKDMIAEEMEAALHEKATPGTRRPARLKRDPDPFGITDEDEEEDFQRARELERATDAGKTITRKQKAAATAARDLPRRSMAQKSQDPSLRAQQRAKERKKRAAYDKKVKRTASELDVDQTMPEPQQSRIRESFDQKGKTKMKLTKNSLKKLIKEELDAVSEGAGEGAFAAKQQMESRLIPLLQEAIEIVDQYVQDVDQQKSARAVSPALRLLEHLKAAQRLADRGMTRSAQGPSRGAVEPVARPGAYNQSLPDSRSRD